MISIRDITTIVREYPVGIRLKRIEPLGSAGGMSGAQFWRIASNRGTLVLRRWPGEHPSPERLGFIHRMLFHAAERGIAFLPAPIRTTNGESFVSYIGQLWELTPWMPGAADYKQSPTTAKLRAAMKALAQFHVAVRDFPAATNQLIAGAAPAISRHVSRLRDLSNGGINELSRG